MKKLRMILRMEKRTNQHTQLGFKSNTFRKMPGINWDTNNNFLVHEFADIIAVASKLEITK